MKIINIKDRDLLKDHLTKNTSLNLYQLGDLDDFFFKYTEWYGVEIGGKIRQVVLIYKGTDLPVLLALCEKGTDEMITLIKEILDKLPGNFYSHISVGLRDAFIKTHSYEFYGKYLKMKLDRRDFLKPVPDLNIRRLMPGDSEMILNFYSKSYPGNWFDLRMLKTGKYFGYFEKEDLIGISGIHVYSSNYKIAVLGNITTDADHRGKSVCTKVTSVLCEDLFKTVDEIGLNVHEENLAAIRSYEKIGFRVCNEYEEYMFEKK